MIPGINHLSRPMVYISIAIMWCLILCSDETRARQPLNKYYFGDRTYYILKWISGDWYPFLYIDKGRQKFIDLKCPHQNCYITDDKDYLSDITDFDAIIFNGGNVLDEDDDESTNFELPQDRSPIQKYVFVEMESPQDKYSCNNDLDYFFNWTWTYKLGSNIRWSYILIYNLDGDEVGPKIDMKWPEEMKPLHDIESKAILDGKSKAAAWFVSHCKTLGRRENFVKELKPELYTLNLTLDVYGKCGNLECPKNKSDLCNIIVKKVYYFYFSFENSIAPDYVTEKLLIALDNYAIPVVYGGADYSRFLPPGSYLNARELGPERLARTMKEIIENRTRFYDFFRWRNHFRYKDGVNDTEICNICTALNEDKDNNFNFINSFRKWWIEGVPNVSRICMNEFNVTSNAVHIKKIN